MVSQLASAAMIPNPRLAVFKPLIGEWATVGFHTMMPGITLHGRTVFEWHDGGAFLRIRSEIDEPGIPSAIALIGTDERYALTVAPDGDTLRGVSSLSKDDVTWDQDLELSYTRVE